MCADGSKIYISHRDLVSELLTGVYSAGLLNPYTDGSSFKFNMIETEVFIPPLAPHPALPPFFTPPGA